VQAVTEEIVMKLAAAVARETGERNLCLAGGVALNCVANGKLLKQARSTACGCSRRRAMRVAPSARHSSQPICIRASRAHCPHGDGMSGSFLGPVYAQEDIERGCGRRAKSSRCPMESLIERAASASPRAKRWAGTRDGWSSDRGAGRRSILGDARSPTMQSILNLKVKYRESFRPFAPSVLREDVAEWFELDADSPTCCSSRTSPQASHPDDSRAEMLFGIDQLNVPRSSIPAVTHVAIQRGSRPCTKIQIPAITTSSGASRR
jgi:carbamoyltransferase